MPADVKTLAPTDAILISRPDDHNMSTWSLHFLSSPISSIRHCDHLNIFHEFPIVSRLKSKILITCPARCPIIGPLLPPEAHPAHPLSLLGTPSPPTLWLLQRHCRHFCLRAFAHASPSPTVSILPTLSWPTPTYPLGLS